MNARHPVSADAPHMLCPITHRAGRLAGLAIAVLAAALVACSWPPDANAADVTWAWLPPAVSMFGEPIPPDYCAFYRAQLRTNGGDWQAAANTDSTAMRDGVLHVLVTLHELEPSSVYELRVAGVDHLGREGLWSEASEPYRPLDGDAGPPGLLTRPAVIQAQVYFMR